MKKFVKYSIYWLIYIVVIFFLAIMFIVTAKADIIKPNTEIKPYQVVMIQLNSLRDNDKPNKDNGIKQTWEFAHPDNRNSTGPLNRFTLMLKGESYMMLLNHLEHKILKLQSTDSLASYEITILDKDKTYYKFLWQVEKYNKDGPLKGCWLTTMVSSPMPLGSSI